MTTRTRMEDIQSFGAELVRIVKRPKTTLESPALARWRQPFPTWGIGVMIVNLSFFDVLGHE